MSFSKTFGGGIQKSCRGVLESSLSSGVEVKELDLEITRLLILVLTIEKEEKKQVLGIQTPGYDSYELAS